MPDRNHAVALLHEWVENEGLRRHMYAVEAAVRFYARKMGADEELWGLAGLLHDLDWEKSPDVHPMKGVEALEEAGYPEEVIHAVLAHRPEYTGWNTETELDRVLRAGHEISGFIHDASLMPPNGIDDVTPKTVVKKLKEEAFAAGVDWEQVARMRDAAEIPGIKGMDLQTE